MFLVNTWLRRSFLLGLALSCLLALACEAPEPCKIDDDCAKKEFVCRGDKCVLQDYCEKDSNCQYKGETCQIGKCVVEAPPEPPPPLTCPSSCLSDSQCSACKDGRLFCLKGECLKQERVGQYQRCGTVVGNACNDGFSCTGVTETNRYCFADCDPSQPRCDGGKAGCYNPFARDKGICVPDGEGVENNTCSDRFEGEKELDQKLLCKPGLQCVNNKCINPKEVGDYQQCGPGFKCSAQATCVVLSAESEAGYCLPLCDIAQSACNGTAGRCIKLQSGKGACILNGTSKEDNICGPTGAQLKPEHLCASPLQCITLTKGSVCLNTVQQCADNACPQGRICLAGSAGGVCGLACDANTKCPTGLSCQAIPLATGNVNLCAP